MLLQLASDRKDGLLPFSLSMRLSPRFRPAARFFLGTVLGLCLLATAPAARAAVNIYVRFSNGQGIYAGEVTTPAAYQGWTAASEVIFGASATITIGSGTGSGSGKATPTNVTVKRLVDRVSPTLLLRLLNGTTLGSTDPAVTVEFFDATANKVLLRLEYKVVYIASLTNDTVDGLAGETLQFAYTAIRMTYDPNGTAPVVTTWNFTTNTSTY